MHFCTINLFSVQWHILCSGSYRNNQKASSKLSVSLLFLFLRIVNNWFLIYMEQFFSFMRKNALKVRRMWICTTAACQMPCLIFFNLQCAFLPCIYFPLSYMVYNNISKAMHYWLLLITCMYMYLWVNYHVCLSTQHIHVYMHCNLWPLKTLFGQAYINWTQDQICMQVNACVWLFGHPVQVNLSHIIYFK